MSALIHALFDRPEIAAKALADLGGAGIALSEISLVEGRDSAVHETSYILDQHGLSSETAATYIHVLAEGGAFLWLRFDPATHKEADITALLERDGAILIDTATINDDADALNEAEGWDDFNQHGNEHSPDLGAESMWTSRNGGSR